MILNLANQVTLLRILCIPIFVTSMLYLEAGRIYLRYVPLIVFFIAVISDALDGFIARMFNQKTQLGKWLDPIADKLLLVSAFILLASLNSLSEFKLPIWLVVIVLSRDIILILGSAIIHMLKGQLVFAPSYLGKITTLIASTETILTEHSFDIKTTQTTPLAISNSKVMIPHRAPKTLKTLVAPMFPLP